MLSTARPIVPPASREVLSTPEASPLSCWGTPRTATIVAGTIEEPAPSVASTPPGRTPVT